MPEMDRDRREESHGLFEDLKSNNIHNNVTVFVEMKQEMLSVKCSGRLARVSACPTASEPCVPLMKWAPLNIRPVIFNLSCSHTLRYNFCST
jgi:hypothetical protein